MLESLKDTNIKDLVIEGPARNFDLFDPEKELTADDWETIDFYLDFFSDSDGVTYLEFLLEARALSPKRYGHIEPTAHQWVNVVKGYKEMGRNEKLDEKSRFGACIRPFSEAKFKQFKVSENDLRRLDQTIENSFRNSQIFSNDNRVYKKILSPERSVEFTEAEWDPLVGRLDIYSHFQSSMPVEHAAYMKMLDPVKYARVEAKYHTQLLRIGRTRLQVQRTSLDGGERPENFIDTALYLYILSAKAVEITARGLSITPYEPESKIDLNTNHELPVRRNF